MFKSELAGFFLDPALPGTRSGRMAGVADSAKMISNFCEPEKWAGYRHGELPYKVAKLQKMIIFLDTFMKSRSIPQSVMAVLGFF